MRQLGGTKAWYRRAYATPLAGITSDRTLRRLRRKARDAQVFVVVRSGDLQSIGMKVHIAGEAGKFEAMVIFLGVRLPEQQKPTAAAAAESHD